MSRTILHVDMDAFYTSVEQRDHPEYRGKPVVVGADPKGGKGRGVVAAASYEARRFGVHSAMPIGRAYRLCPQAIYLRGDMEKYVRASKRIMGILASYTDLVEQLSIDEAFMDVTGSLSLFGAGREIAAKIKSEIRTRESLTASIGIAPNKFLAKIASDLGKPDGLLEVEPGGERAFLSNLPVERLWGVGPRTAEELHKLGLYTIEDITRLTEAELVERFGKHGSHLFELARGIDERPVVPEQEPKSIGQETTFDEDVGDAGVVRRTLLELAEAVTTRLRKHGVEGRTITLKFRDEYFTTETRAETLPDATADASEIFETALDLLGRIRTAGRKVRLLGISVGKLAAVGAGPRQLRLFTSPRDRSRADRAVDSVRARWGDRKLTRASLIHPSPEEEKETR